MKYKINNSPKDKWLRLKDTASAIFSGSKISENDDKLNRLIDEWPQFLKKTKELEDAGFSDDKSIAQMAGVLLAQANSFFDNVVPTTSNELITALCQKNSLFEKQIASIEQIEAELIKNSFYTTETTRTDTVDVKSQEIDTLVQSLAEKDAFFNALQKEVIEAIFGEKKRLFDNNINDPRIEALQNTLNKTNETIADVIKQCASTHMNGGSTIKINAIKSECKQLILDTIRSELLENNALHQHQQTGTKFGRMLYNAVLAIPVAGVRALFGLNRNSIFYSMKTQSENNMENIVDSASKITPTGGRE